ncbi:MAG: glycosyltransferase family 39 protein [Anaerolineae bacterium]|nr:glycosyltransferase family 39 protein [Anaerolineae bacterium]
MLPHRSLSLMVLFIWLAFWLRLVNLGFQELRADEGYSFPYTQMPLAQVIPALIPVGEEHAPLHYLVLNVWANMAGTSEFVLRYLAVLPGVLLLPLLFRWGRRLQGEKLGLLMALFAAVSQSLVWLAQDVRNQYVMVMFMTTLATLLLARAVARPSVTRWLLYALACALTIYSHYYGVFALLSHGLFLLLGARRLLWQWLLAGLVAALLFAPWLAATLPGWLGQLTVPGNPQLFDYLLTVGQELAVGPAFDHPAGPWVLALAAALAVVGWLTLWQRGQRPWAALLGFWLVSTAVTVYLVLLRRSIFNAYYIAPAAPAWWALVSLGILALAQNRRWMVRATAVASAGIVLTAAALSLVHYHGNVVQYGRYYGYRDIAAHIADNREPGDVFVAHFPDPALTYYLWDVDIPQTMQPASFPADTAVTEQALADLAAAYDRIWFVPAHHSPFWDPENIAFRWLDYHTLLEQVHQYPRLELFAFRPDHAASRAMTPLNETVNGQLRLAGVRLLVNGASVTTESLLLHPGDELIATLQWEAVAEIPRDYTVFVHLLTADGALLAQHDSAPLWGTRPTTTWQPGEMLLDRHVLALPTDAPPTAVRLLTGLYDSQTIERQLFTNGQDAVELSVGVVDGR